ncbi:MAG: hypothetical protein LH481_12095 [Burkholderiales bacterium]|nr:hypothetical protein [Burkholderiales bacterium]
MNRFVLLVASVVIMAVLNSCGGKGGTADAASDFTAIPGDGVVTLAWTAEPGVEYWLFYAAGSSVTTSNWSTIGGTAVINVTSPYTITGLKNGSTYSFTMNGRKGGGPGGAGAPTKVVMPRFAGAKWNTGTALGTGKLNGIAALAAIDVTVGSGGTIFAGANGTIAAARVNPAVPADLNAVTYGGLGFAAVGSAGTIVFSTDGLTWATRTSGSVADLYALASPGGGSIAAFGAAGTTLFSSGGATWTTATSATTQGLFAATYGGGRYVAVGAGGAIVTSTNGTTWQAVVSNTTSDLRAVSMGTFVTTTGTGTTAPTTTTTTYVALGAAGTVVTSSDGLTWTARAPISANTMNGVAFAGQFVAVGNAGSIYTSADGITWTAQISGTTNSLSAIARTSSGYTAVGAAGTLLTSF